MVKRTDRIIEDKIVSKYKDGKGTIKLAKEFNLCRATIQRILISRKITLRKGRGTSYSHNEYFFSEYNRKSCYWAGFVAADGCVRNKDRKALHIKLSSIDREHLYKFLSDIESDYKVKDSNLGYSYVDVSGGRIISSLKNNFYISNNKSLTLRFPENVPIEFIPDFIRGYFDGDGSVYIDKNDTVGASFTGTKDVLDFFRNYFYYAVGVRIKSKNKVPPFSKAGKNYFLSYSGKNAIKILNHMYDKSNVYLERKYLKWKLILSGLE